MVSIAKVLSVPTRRALSPERVVRLALLALPVLFAGPILVSLVRVLVDAAQPHPFFNDISGTTADARAIALGAPLYQDPAVGYTPLVYTPLMSLTMAGLNQLYTWDGWAIVLTILAEAGLIGLGVRLAWGSPEEGRPERAAAVAGAVGVGAMAFWLMAFVPFNFVFAPRPDQLSWGLGLLGLAMVPAAARGSRRFQVAAVVLLTGAFWTKQTTLPVLLVAVLWLALEAGRGRVRVRTAVGLSLALLAINLVLLGAVVILTDGWAWRFIVEFPERRAEVVSTLHSIGDLLESVLVPAGVAAVSWGAALQARRQGAPWPRETVGVASILALFLVVDVPFSVWFREAQGAVHNMYIGIGWACGLLLAAGWGIARARAASLVVVTGVVGALFVASESPALQSSARTVLHAHVPPKSLRIYGGYEPPALLRYAQHHRVYNPAYPGIGAHRLADMYPGGDNIEALLWSGVQPRHLVEAFLQRRFDLVYLFENDGYRGDSDGYGPWEDNYFWKLNQVITAKYRPATGPRRRLKSAGLVFIPVAPFYSPYVFERRPGPDPAPWMNTCFGPFRVPGATFRIARGGGFWCELRRGDPTLTLMATPARRTEIRDDHFHAGPDSALKLHFAYGGEVRISLGAWHVVRRGGLDSHAVVRLPPGGHGGLSIVSTRNSGVAVRLVRRSV
jgi:hypothetical protein